MNTLFINIRKSLLTALLGGVSLVSLANSNSPVNGGGNSANSAAVTYIPLKQGDGVFNVRYDNAAGNRFSLVVLDGDGDQLYSNIFSDKNFDKNFKLADPDSYRKIVFVIRNLNDNKTQRFEAEATGHEVEDVNVEEVK